MGQGNIDNQIRTTSHSFKKKFKNGAIKLVNIVVSYDNILCCVVSYCLIYHPVSYRIVLYRIVSYHILYCIIYITILVLGHHTYVSGPPCGVSRIMSWCTVPPVLQ